MFPGLDLHCADRAQLRTTAGEELDDLDYDLSEVCIFSLRNLKSGYVTSMNIVINFETLSIDTPRPRE